MPRSGRTRLVHRGEADGYLWGLSMTMDQNWQAMEDLEDVSTMAPDSRFAAEEFANAFTHGFGLVLSILGAVLLIGRALSGNLWHVAGCAIFAATLIAVYAASTLSHVYFSPGLRRRFRTLDQASIYLLIVGTCTPYALAYLRDGWWPLLLGFMWILALSGAVSKIFFSHRIEAVAIYLYILLGWMPILFTPWLVERVPVPALWWMLIGGLFYTAGTIFLILDTRYPHFHAVWHLFVIAGSSCHFYGIFVYVASLPADPRLIAWG